jgi:hypothetical protein
MGNGHRVYLPSLMRFSSPDVMSPFGKGGTNPYAYCAGDPIDRSDPSGNFSVFAILGAGMAIGGLALGIHNSARAWSTAASALGEGGEGLLSRTGGMAAAHAAGAVSAFSAAKLGVTLTFTASMGGPHQFARNMRLFGAGIGLTMAGAAPLALKKRTLSNDRERLLDLGSDRADVQMEDIPAAPPATHSDDWSRTDAQLFAGREFEPTGRRSLRSHLSGAVADAAHTVRNVYRRVVGTGEMSSHRITVPFQHHDQIFTYSNPAYAPVNDDLPYHSVIYDPTFSLGDEDGDL